MDLMEFNDAYQKI